MNIFSITGGFMTLSSIVALFYASARWGIKDTIDEKTGRRRKRAIQEIQTARTSVISGTTSYLERYSSEDSPSMKTQGFTQGTNFGELEGTSRFTSSTALDNEISNGFVSVPEPLVPSHDGMDMGIISTDVYEKTGVLDSSADDDVTSILSDVGEDFEQTSILAEDNEVDLSLGIQSSEHTSSFDNTSEFSVSTVDETTLLTIEEELLSSEKTVELGVSDDVSLIEESFSPASHHAISTKLTVIYHNISLEN